MPKFIKGAEKSIAVSRTIEIVRLATPMSASRLTSSPTIPDQCPCASK